MFTYVLGRYALLSKSYYYTNLSEGADSIGGQMHGDKEYVPFNDVTSYGGAVRRNGAGNRNHVSIGPWHLGLTN